MDFHKTSVGKRLFGRNVETDYLVHQKGNGGIILKPKLRKQTGTMWAIFN
jgi:hypothetical protein